MAGAIKRKNVNGGARHELDKFYTHPDVAKTVIATIQSLINEADIVVEPSAGSGSFSKQITHKNLLAYDLHPEADDIAEANWFEISRDQLGNGNLLVVGNPPFGVRSDLAKKFILQSVSLNAETIAFLLPKTFSKALNQKSTLFPEQYRLVIEDDIPEDSFTVDGETYHIPCRWYVWTKNITFKPGVNLRKTLLEDSPDFMFMPRGSVEADFTLNGNNGRVKNLEQVTNPKAEHYIRVTDRDQIDTVRSRFEKLNFDFNSSVNGGVAWVGKQEILAAYVAVDRD